MDRLGIRDLASFALLLVWGRRNRRRGGIRIFHRNRAQVVPRPARLRRRAHRGRLRLRHRAHHPAHSVDDRVEGVPEHVHRLGSDSRSVGPGGGAVPAEGPVDARVQPDAAKLKVVQNASTTRRDRWCAPERSGSVPDDDHGRLRGLMVTPRSSPSPPPTDGQARLFSGSPPSDSP
jgi:hypothetical protein